MQVCTVSGYQISAPVQIVFTFSLLVSAPGRSRWSSRTATTSTAEKPEVTTLSVISNALWWSVPLLFYKIKFVSTGNTCLTKVEILCWNSDKHTLKFTDVSKTSQISSINNYCTGGAKTDFPEC